MPHAVDAHDPNLVGNLIDDAVIAHADASVIFAAREFVATGRARICCQGLNRRDDALMHLRRKPGEIFFRTAFKQDTIHDHLRWRSAR